MNEKHSLRDPLTMAKRTVLSVSVINGLHGPVKSTISPVTGTIMGSAGVCVRQFVTHDSQVRLKEQVNPSVTFTQYQQFD